MSSPARLETPALAGAGETGLLGVCHLKRLWSSTIRQLHGLPAGRGNEWHRDRLVIDALGLSLDQALGFLHAASPSFDAFERWILDTAGRPDPQHVGRFNALMAGESAGEDIRRWLHGIGAMAPVLLDADLARWRQDGYVVVRGAVDREACKQAENAIWAYIGADPGDRESWYRTALAGIMVELIQHPALACNRRALRIHKAFAQLWETADLWGSTDRCGFHPPQRRDYPFPGPDLHWDLDFSRPLQFGTQGILYLTDTRPDQGALTLVPGFQHRLPDWLAGLPAGADPMQEDLHALGAIPVGGKAGDLVIWHQWLPHGSRPNLADQPRIVQYINMYPGVMPT